MDQIKIRGGQPLNGQIEIGGAKNAALPLMAACLLSEKPVTLSNVPHLADITTMANLLVHLGVDLELLGRSGGGVHAGRTLKLDGSKVSDTVAPYDIVRRMRASVIVLGPLLARFGHARVSLPGGCAIGTRPIDLHLMAMEALGADITLEEGYIETVAKKGLRGAEIHFPQVSVGATENALLAATLAEGTSVLHNAAREPEISDLAVLLRRMGAKITGEGTEIITVEGVTSLQPTDHSVLADRIEAGTYAVAAAMTGGNIELIGARADTMQRTLDVLRACGVTIEKTTQGIRAIAGRDRLRPQDITTAPYPGFATDMQAQLMALLVLADGTSHVTETIFENRFMHVPELTRMGAHIRVDGHTATIEGVKKLAGAEVMATDLRASVSLVLAALAAEGETTINRVYHIDRGYEFVESKLASCGADIQRIRKE
ncbi:MAG: UDP-N-acetylglucosamine 1-carboxyvinyltransferase [Hyphomicrobiales bacterium]|nr:UDP-N-acetylglucosamine 1-carboxyvinyltransferase [Hyphomicrobiales bacterium]